MLSNNKGILLYYGVKVTHTIFVYLRIFYVIVRIGGILNYVFASNNNDKLTQEIIIKITHEDLT